MAACQPFRRARVTRGRTVKMTVPLAISKTQASRTHVSRTYSEREEHDRISAHLDQALEMTFPCSDPVPIQLTRSTTYSDAKLPRILEESLSPSSVSKD